MQPCTTHRGEGADDVLEIVLLPGCVGLRDLRHGDEEGQQPHQRHEAEHLARSQGAVSGRNGGFVGVLSTKWMSKKGLAKFRDTCFVRADDDADGLCDPLRNIQYCAM